MFQDQKDIENRLSALGEHLENLADEPVEFLVCGGSALIILDFVQRATKDVDILAYVKKTASGDIEFINAKPLDDQLVEAAGNMTHDESEGYRQVLKDLLNHMGYKDVAEKL